MPYLHVTTKIENHPHDGLLKEKGFGSFPSLCFMDAEGNVLAKQGERSVAGFEKTLAALTEVTDLKARIAAGKKGLECSLFLAEWRLGAMDWVTTQARAQALQDLSKEQKAEVAQVLLDAEVLHLASNVREPPQFEAAAKRFLEILEAGKTMPSAWSEKQFWHLLLRKADMAPPDAELYEKALAALERIHKDEEHMKQALEKYRARLAELKKPGA